MTLTAAAPPLLPAPDPELHDKRDRDDKLGRPRRGAIIAAALVHIAVILALLLNWPFALKAPPVEHPPIPVALVRVVPRPPAAPKPPPALPKPKPKAFPELRSGPDQVTTAPPEAQAKGAEAAPKPSSAVPPQPAAPTPALPKPAPPVPQPKPREAKRETAPKPTKRSVVARAAPGETVKTGDPYLNRLNAMIESHRFYPTNAIGPLGLKLQGTVVYIIAVAPSGAILNIHLAQSSGATVLDETARKMIEEAAPFPPLPNYYPHDGVTLTVTTNIFPPIP